MFRLFLALLFVMVEGMNWVIKGAVDALRAVKSTFVKQLPSCDHKEDVELHRKGKYFKLEVPKACNASAFIPCDNREDIERSYA